MDTVCFQGYVLLSLFFMNFFKNYLGGSAQQKGVCGCMFGRGREIKRVVR